MTAPEVTNEEVVEEQQSAEAEAVDTDPAEQSESELPEWVQQKLSKANREAQNLRNRLKEQEPLVQAAQEAERANMTELEQQRADNDALKAQLAARDTEVLQAKYSLTDEDLEFIGDGTFEERQARAEKFAARVQSAAVAEVRPPSERPVESLKPGASPSTPPVEDNSYPAGWRPQPAGS